MDSPTPTANQPNNGTGCTHPNCERHGKSPCEGVGCDGLTDRERAALSGAPVTENEVLDLLFEALPDTVEADLYPTRPTLPRPEFYIKVRGECWRITAQHHPHQQEQPDA